MNSYDLSRTCRLCGCQDAYIYTDVLKSGSRYTNMFSELACIKFDDRKLPTVICPMCIAKTCSYYKLLQGLPDLEKKLEAHFNTVTNNGSSSESTESSSKVTNSNNQIDSKPIPSTSYQTATSTTTPTVNREHHVASNSDVEFAAEPSTSNAKKRNNEDPAGIRLTLTKDKNDFKIKRAKKPTEETRSRSSKDSSVPPKKKNDLQVKQPKQIEKAPSRSPLGSPLVHEASTKNSSVPPQKKSKLSEPNLKKTTTEIVSPKPSGANDNHHVRNGNKKDEKNKSDDMWQELKLPGKSPVYLCRKCKLLLMSEKGKNSHVC